MYVKGSEDMPDVIDNAKVGSFIKERLKEHGMTQETLAEHLNISKSAVSQNLNGRSSFDLNNLVRIAKLFDVSLERLLLQSSEKSKETISEYERIVRAGLDELEKVSSERLKEVDIYGKVIVEYVIELNKITQFEHLIARDVPLFKPYAPNAQELYYKVILFIVQHGLNGLSRMVKEYVQSYNQLRFEDERYESLIVKTMNQPAYTEKIKSLMHERIGIEQKLFNIIPVRKSVPVMGPRNWIEVICRNQAHILLKAYLDVHMKPEDLNHFMKQALAHDFDKGIELMRAHLKQSDLDDRSLESLNAQEAVERLIDMEKFDHFKAYVGSGIHQSVDALLDVAINKQRKAFYEHLLNHASQPIDYRRAALNALNVRDTALLRVCLKQVDKETKDVLLSRCQDDDFASMKALFDSGARFTIKHYRYGTYKKINHWIETLLNKGDDA